MSFMPPPGPDPSNEGRPAPSSGWRRAPRHIAALFSAVVAVGTMALAPAAAAGGPVHLVALGDSLTAGYGLPAPEGFVPRLNAALAAHGVDAVIDNAGVSGDTASDGLARLDWSTPDGTDGAIVELGANDMLRGIDPAVTRQALDTILSRLTARHIAVMVCGMRAAPNLGADFGTAFDSIYPALATKYGAVFYPFFLDGVAGDLKLLQADGMHPNTTGVEVIVGRILPTVMELVARLKARPPEEGLRGRG